MSKTKRYFLSPIEKNTDIKLYLLKIFANFQTRNFQFTLFETLYPRNIWICGNYSPSTILGALSFSFLFLLLFALLMPKLSGVEIPIQNISEMAVLTVFVVPSFAVKKSPTKKCSLASKFIACHILNV